MHAECGGMKTHGGQDMQTAGENLSPSKHVWSWKRPYRVNCVDLLKLCRLREVQRHNTCVHACHTWLLYVVSHNS